MRRVRAAMMAGLAAVTAAGAASAQPPGFDGGAYMRQVQSDRRADRQQQRAERGADRRAERPRPEVERPRAERCRGNGAIIGAIAGGLLGGRGGGPADRGC